MIVPRFELRHTFIQPGAEGYGIWDSLFEVFVGKQILCDLEWPIEPIVDLMNELAAQTIPCEEYGLKPKS